MEILYDESMIAAMWGNRERSNRLHALAERALIRCQRRRNAFRGNQSSAAGPSGGNPH
jgi:hypothetical protein